jgi:hypothetical protein
LLGILLTVSGIIILSINPIWYHTHNTTPRTLCNVLNIQIIENITLISIWVGFFLKHIENIRFLFSILKT